MRIFLRPKKISDRSLDPKKYRACKFSTQKNTSDPQSCILRVPPWDGPGHTAVSVVLLSVKSCFQLMDCQILITNAGGYVC